ncbi:MAG: hypothetical protein JWQ29_1736, partial [Phenylobacterium sp.]|nr:hypothetical protein [Phenylobacterium sp.]
DKGAFVAARRIESDIQNEGSPVGEVFADRAELAARYGVGRATLVEAIRILEARGVVKMRRGPGGGLVVLPMPRPAVIAGVVNYLRLRGVTADQTREAGAALEIMARYAQACRAGPAAREAFGRDFRAELAAAAPEDPLRWREPGERPDLSDVDDAAVRLFFSCLDQLGAVDDPCPGPSGGGSKGSLAEQVGRTLAVELARPRSAGSARIGTEGELCDRFGVSRLVMRQAVRVLEGHGVIESHRGRNRGLVAGTPKPTAVIELIVALFSSMGLTDDDIAPSRRMLGRLTRLLAVAKATPAQQAQYLDLSVQQDPAAFKDWVDLDLAIADNPALSVMARALTGYKARLGGHRPAAFDDEGDEIARNLRRHLDAVARGDVAEADSSFDAVLTRASAASRPVTAPSAEPVAA